MAFAQWNPQSFYVVGDTVYDGPDAYTAVANNTNLQPSLNTPVPWVLFNPPPTPVVDSLNTLTGLVSLVAGTGIIVSPAVPTPQDIQIVNAGVLALDGAAGVLTTKTGQYYRTSLQSLTSGSTDIIFQAAQSWTDLTSISWTGPSAAFTVAVKGLYQLEFAVSVDANGATWTIGTNKGASIDITRPPSAEVIILPTNALMASGVNYGQVATATYALEIGDVINCRVANTFSTATPFAIPQSGFDLSTFFTWTLIKPLP